MLDIKVNNFYNLCGHLSSEDMSAYFFNFDYFVLWYFPPVPKASFASFVIYPDMYKPRSFSIDFSFKRWFIRCYWKDLQ